MFYRSRDCVLPHNAVENFEKQLNEFALPVMPDFLRHELLALSREIYLNNVFHTPLAITLLLGFQPTNTSFDKQRLINLAQTWNNFTAGLHLPDYTYSYLFLRSPVLSHLQNLWIRYLSKSRINFSQSWQSIDHLSQPAKNTIDIDLIFQATQEKYEYEIRERYRLFAETIIDIFKPAWSSTLNSNAYSSDSSAIYAVVVRFFPVPNTIVLTTNDLRSAISHLIVGEIDHLQTLLSKPATDKYSYIQQNRTTKNLKDKLRRALSLFLNDSLLQTPEFTQYRARIIGTPIRVTKKQKHSTQVIALATPDTPHPSKHGVVSRQSSTQDVPALTKQAHIVVPFSLPDLPHPEQTLSTPRTEGTSLIGALYYSIEDPKPDLASKAFTPILHLSNSGTTSSISARKNIQSKFDPHRLSTGIIGPYFSYLLPLDTLTACYAWICLFSGLNWQFLTQLECGNGPCEDNKRFYFDRQTGILTYPMSDSATQFLPEVAGTPSMHVMRLLLPDMISNVLGKVASSRPFLGIDDHAQKKAKYFARKLPVARTPTPERLNATFASTIARFGGHLDPHERAWIQGDSPYYLRAQLHYRQIQLQTINNRHQHTVSDYTAHLLNVCRDAPNIDWLIPNYSLPTPQGRIGSEVYCEPSVYREFMQAVAHKHAALHRLAGRHPDSKNLETWISLVNVQQINLYVLAQLCLGLRPIGKTIDIVVTDARYGCLVRDKASAEFTELTHSPLPRVLSDQIRACHLGIARFKRYLRAIGTTCNLDVSENTKAIAILVQMRSSTHAQRIFSTRMQGEDFESLLQQLDLVKDFRRPVQEANCFRHLLVTELASRLSPSVLSEFVGHQHSGLEYYSPWSTVRGPILPKIEHALDEILKDISPSVLRITL